MYIKPSHRMINDSFPLAGTLSNSNGNFDYVDAKYLDLELKSEDSYIRAFALIVSSGYVSSMFDISFLDTLGISSGFATAHIAWVNSNAELIKCRRLINLQSNKEELRDIIDNLKA